MDGILIIDKPAGITSHDVVARVRRLFETKRVGHTGTLDPFATGVMVVLLGKATRLAQFLEKDRKEYIAEIQFGFATDTGDLTGTAIEGSGFGIDAAGKALAEIDLEESLIGFRGEIEQVPPMYSAKKVDGTKLYELARRGVEIKRKANTVTVYELAANTDPGSCNTGKLSIRVVCSAGTYVRTLAEDIGRATGLGAHLTALRRTAAGRFGIDQSHTFEDLDRMAAKEAALLPIELAVEHLPELCLADSRIGPTQNGLPTRVAEGSFGIGEAVRMGQSGGLIAIGYFDAEESVVQPKIVLA